MSAPGTTPGPWEADHTSVHADSGIIADLYLDDATAEANANLIAAAPELYAACAVAAPLIAAYKDDDAMWACFSQIIRALAKAGGEA